MQSYLLADVSQLHSKKQDISIKFSAVLVLYKKTFSFSALSVKEAFLTDRRKNSHFFFFYHVTLLMEDRINHAFFSQHDFSVGSLIPSWQWLEAARGMQSNEENFIYPNSVYATKLYALIFHSLKAELSSEITVTWFLSVKVFGTFSSLVISLYIMPPVQLCLIQAIYLEYFCLPKHKLKINTSNKCKRYL